MNQLHLFHFEIRKIIQSDNKLKDRERERITWKKREAEPTVVERKSGGAHGGGREKIRSSPHKMRVLVGLTNQLSVYF